MPSQTYAPSTQRKVSSGENVSTILRIDAGCSYLVLVWSHAEVLDSLSRVLWSSEEKGVASSWSSQRQLIKSQSLTTSSDNASTGCSSESESSNAELGDGQETVVISDGANNHNGLVVGLLGGVADDSGYRDRRSVNAGHKESAKNNLVEGGVGSAY